jgi:hypothetical protein
MIEAVYEDGRYGQQIDYLQEPFPPLPEEDTVWADSLLRRAGLR